MKTLVKTPEIEAALDIAFLAGACRYHSGDSREDIDTFLRLALEFEQHRKTDKDGNQTYFGKDYLTAIEEFAFQELGLSKREPEQRSPSLSNFPPNTMVYQRMGGAMGLKL